MPIDRRQVLAGAGAVAGLGLAGCASQPVARPYRGRYPLIIAHRGASGHRPEHTLAAYALAIEQGADFIEPDLVLTKDGVLVCRHENEISETTDVATKPEFAARRATKTIDGQTVSGWFTEDFTLAELKTLRCRERLPQLRPQNTAFDGQDTIPTFAEVIALAQRLAGSDGGLGRIAPVVGVYPETKHPSYFQSLGLDFDAPLLADLTAAGWTDEAAPVFIQSFEVGNLQRLRTKTVLSLVQLIGSEGGPADLPDLTYAEMATAEGLDYISDYARGVGPHKSLIVPRDAAGRSLAPTQFVWHAKDVGLAVHPWTFRSENMFLPLELRRGDGPAAYGDAVAELAAFMRLGVDGVFADFPDVALAARDLAE